MRRILHRAALQALLLLAVSACATSSDPTQTFVDKTVSASVQQYGFPAAAVAFITSDDIHVSVAGKRRSDRPDPATVTDHFGLGSNGKAITATMLAVLVEQGILRWDLTLAEALPDVSMRPEYRAVTLHQLLTHRAGLPGWNTREAHQRARRFVTTDLASARLAFAEAVLGEAPVSTPGTETRYSNAGYSLASLMAERRTNLSWRELVTDRVCTPLRLRCRFGGPASSDPYQPWGHSRSSGAPLPVDPSPVAPTAMQGAGGVSLSIADYAVFLRMHLRGLRGTDTPLLRADTIRFLHTPEGRYAVGWGIQEFAGAPSSVHAGGDGLYYALVAIQPDRDRAVAFLTNDGGDGVEEQAAAILKTLLTSSPGRARRAR